MKTAVVIRCDALLAALIVRVLQRLAASEPRALRDAMLSARVEVTP